MGLGGKENLNLKVGEVYGEEWMDVSGEWKTEGMTVNGERERERERERGSCEVHRS